MGTPDFALPALDYLISSEQDVVAIYTQPDKVAGRGRIPVPPPVKKVASDHGLTVCQPISLKQPEEREKLAQLRPDVIITAAFGQLLHRDILDIPPYGCLNIHPSLLPKYRGPSPIAAVIMAGDEISGVSLMLMDEGMDTGPILAQQQISLSSEDTTGLLTATLAQIGAELLRKTLPLWFSGELTPKAQVEEKATYSRRISKGDGEVDWRCPAEELGRKVRAFQPWPGCYTTWQGKLVKIIAAVPLSGQGEPGKVITVSEQPEISLGIQTGEGVLGLLKLQLEGKRVITAEEFARGQKDFVGALLPC